MSTTMLYRMCGGRRAALHKAGSSRFVAHAQDDSCPLRRNDANPPKHIQGLVFHSHFAEEVDMLPDKTSTTKQENQKIKHVS